jgi:hypothetical protein
MVVVIYTGERWEGSQGRYLRHKGTASYLKNIGAKIVPNSAKVIDAREVDDKGGCACQQKSLHAEPLRKPRGRPFFLRRLKKLVVKMIFVCVMVGFSHAPTTLT